MRIDTTELEALRSFVSHQKDGAGYDRFLFDIDGYSRSIHRTVEQQHKALAYFVPRPIKELYPAFSWLSYYALNHSRLRTLVDQDQYDLFNGRAPSSLVKALYPNSTFHLHPSELNSRLNWLRSELGITDSNTKLPELGNLEQILTLFERFEAERLHAYLGQHSSGETLTMSQQQTPEPDTGAAAKSLSPRNSGSTSSDAEASADHSAQHSSEAAHKAADTTATMSDNVNEGQDGPAPSAPVTAADLDGKEGQAYAHVTHLLTTGRTATRDLMETALAMDKEHAARASRPAPSAEPRVSAGGHLIISGEMLEQFVNKDGTLKEMSGQERTTHTLGWLHGWKAGAMGQSIPAHFHSGVGYMPDRLREGKGFDLQYQEHHQRIGLKRLTELFGNDAGGDGDNDDKHRGGSDRGGNGRGGKSGSGNRGGRGGGKGFQGGGRDAHANEERHHKRARPDHNGHPGAYQLPPQAHGPLPAYQPAPAAHMFAPAGGYAHPPYSQQAQFAQPAMLPYGQQPLYSQQPYGPPPAQYPSRY